MVLRSSLVLWLISALSGAAEIKVVVEGVKNAKGQMRLVIYDKADSFPDQPDKALRRYSQPAARASGGKLSFTMPDLGKGQFAFVVLHDEDGDKKLAKNFLGFPKEGLAISNYTKPRPPKFKKAAVKDPKGALTLKLVY